MNRRNFNPGQARRSGGFTLLELLLAFMVFALSFATVLEILSGSMRNTVRARHFTEAALTAQSIMDQVGVVIPLQPGERVNGDSGDYRWDLEIYEYQGGESEMSPVELAEEAPEVRAALDSLPAAGAGPEEALERKELGRLVHATLDRLPPRYGQALEWKYIDGLPVKEIARRLAVGPKAAESILTRARQALTSASSVVRRGSPASSKATSALWPFAVTRAV